MTETITCNICDQTQCIGQLTPGETASCVNCGTILKRSRSNSRARTAALSLAALFLYVPANIYPIMRMQYLGRVSESTVWSGVVRLSQDGMWFIAAVVFMASIFIPLVKLLGLFLLVSNFGARTWRKARNWIYRVITAVGPWAMLDVFLLAILVALVKLRSLAEVTPGPGIIPFAGVVILALLASASFDQRLIWEEGES